jgi:hypothetical protein
MNMTEKHSGKCFCGSVQLEVSGSPEVMAYCHCNDCRSWGASPVSAFTLWKPDNVKFLKGSELLEGYDKGTRLHGGGEVISERYWCKQCGGHVYTDHPTMGVYDIPAAVIQGFNFQPMFHVHYESAVLPLKDGLPKFKDLPSEAGGTGETLAE